MLARNPLPRHLSLQLLSQLLSLLLSLFLVLARHKWFKHLLHWKQQPPLSLLWLAQVLPLSQNDLVDSKSKFDFGVLADIFASMELPLIVYSSDESILRADQTVG